MVVGYQSIMELLQKRPTTREALLQIDGFSNFKVARYGDAFLAVFRGTKGKGVGVSSNAASSSCAVQPTPPASKPKPTRSTEGSQSLLSPIDKQQPGPIKRTLSASAGQTYESWKKLKDVRKVALARGLRPKV